MYYMRFILVRMDWILREMSAKVILGHTRSIPDVVRFLMSMEPGRNQIAETGYPRGAQGIYIT
jgi:hypothetical protein